MRKHADTVAKSSSICLGLESRRSVCDERIMLKVWHHEDGCVYLTYARFRIFHVRNREETRSGREVVCSNP